MRRVLTRTLLKMLRIYQELLNKKCKNHSLLPKKITNHSQIKLNKKQMFLTIFWEL